jgi:hypothetical protein
VFTTARHWSLSWARWIQSTPSHFPKIYCNILPSTPKSSEWTLPFRFPDKNFISISHLSHACYMPHQSHPPWLYQSFSLCSHLQPPPPPGPNIFLSTVFCNTCIHAVSFVWERITEQHRTIRTSIHIRSESTVHTASHVWRLVRRKMGSHWNVGQPALCVAESLRGHDFCTVVKNCHCLLFRQPCCFQGCLRALQGRAAVPLTVIYAVILYFRARPDLILHSINCSVSLSGVYQLVVRGQLSICEF